MPVHDWSQVEAGLFHAFHVKWITALADALNESALPSDYFALAEQRAGGPIPDVLTLRLDADEQQADGGLAVETAPPKARFVRRTEANAYAEKANRLTIRHRRGEIVSIIEIVSPGNKASRSELRSFVTKAADLLTHGIHLLIIDLFPPGPRDPGGIHKAIWDEICEEDFSLPADRPLTIASYKAGVEKVAYVEPVAVGDVLPSIALFLANERYVPAPLEASYQAAWNTFPRAMRRILE